MSTTAPCFLTAAQAAARIKAGTLTSEALIRSCLERIGARDPAVKAWLHVDPDLAIRQARELDKRPPAGPLHGIPFGVKDIMDTADMPTTYNSQEWQDHRPTRDAACVNIVRQAGAVILGKTDTVEFAFNSRKAASRNPYNLAHTPGGSSSGSGAAVGDYQVQCAFGTQTAGSHIRPASFNGIYAIKPSWGTVSREGVHMISAILDTVGWYGRSVDDLILGAQAFRLPGMESLAARGVKGLKIGYCETPYWSRAETGARKAMAVAVERLQRAGVIVEEIALPAHFADIAEAHTMIMFGDGRVALYDEYLRQGGRLHPELKLTVENGRGVTPETLVAAYDLADTCRMEFDAIAAGYDAVLAPAATGEAPKGLHTVGDWIFNGLWTLLHTPCVAIPSVLGDIGLPVGVQLVGGRLSDARLLAVAQSLQPVLDDFADTRATLLAAA
ncbi:amidase [Azorhizobium caulinodans ORS 571]|uniref:Amidase n=1 Tax=Azorhizobium caulinodans (strain ATCC 43989 / DSM 5975 / JCM 20966 / LMG 6465 / NBRC 14845 / NCIMB 13405 / ORS 571) TaxID=438753 RepID=A8IBA3_AZOC5|nr:amidase [Azorhizobium caulinodans]BAF88631.1 amidase [Azorhizobium caulinodans ORS 571]